MFCSKCGASNLDDAAFCQSCGSALGSASPQSSPQSAPPGYAMGSSGAGTGESDSASTTTSQFSLTSAFKDAIALVKSPASFMNNNKERDLSTKTLMINYVAVLALIPLVATLIGDAWYHGLVLGGRGVGYAFGIAIVTYILQIVSVFVVGYIIWKLSPSFGGSGGAVTQVRATRLAAYSFTPAFLIAILDIVPFISFIGILGVLYGLYILYLGLPIMLNTPKDKVISYLIVIVIVTLVVYVVVGAIIGAITAALFLTAFLL